MPPVDIETAQAAQRRLLDEVGANPAVKGIGIAPAAGGGYELKVNVRRHADQAELPRQVDGVPVRVATVGRLRKRSRALGLRAG